MNNETRPRPDWDDYFLGLAFLVSIRSKDISTSHGCIITNKKHMILATGYNSPISGIDDSQVPKNRPDKYLYFTHSEANCVYNLSVSLKHIDGGGTAYITGQPCNNCFQALLQAGVNRFVIANRRGTVLEDEKSKNMFEWLVEQTGVEIKRRDFDPTAFADYLMSFKTISTV